MHVVSPGARSGKTLIMLGLLEPCTFDAGRLPSDAVPRITSSPIVPSGVTLAGSIKRAVRMTPERSTKISAHRVSSAGYSALRIVMACVM